MIEPAVGAQYIPSSVNEHEMQADSIEAQGVILWGRPDLKAKERIKFKDSFKDSYKGSFIERNERECNPIKAHKREASQERAFKDVSKTDKRNKERQRVLSGIGLVPDQTKLSSTSLKNYASIHTAHKKNEESPMINKLRASTSKASDSHFIKNVFQVPTPKIAMPLRGSFIDEKMSSYSSRARFSARKHAEDESTADKNKRSPRLEFSKNIKDEACNLYGSTRLFKSKNAISQDKYSINNSKSQGLTYHTNSSHSKAVVTPKNVPMVYEFTIEKPSSRVKERSATSRELKSKSVIQQTVEDLYLDKSQQRLKSRIRKPEDAKGRRKTDSSAENPSKKLLVIDLKQEGYRQRMRNRSQPPISSKNNNTTFHASKDKAAPTIGLDLGFGSSGCFTYNNNHQKMLKRGKK